MATVAMVMVHGNRGGRRWTVSIEGVGGCTPEPPLPCGAGRCAGFCGRCAGDGGGRGGVRARKGRVRGAARRGGGARRRTWWRGRRRGARAARAATPRGGGAPARDTHTRASANAPRVLARRSTRGKDEHGRRGAAAWVCAWARRGAAHENVHVLHVDPRLRARDTPHRGRRARRCENCAGRVARQGGVAPASASVEVDILRGELRARARAGGRIWPRSAK